MSDESDQESRKPPSYSEKLPSYEEAIRESEPERSNVENGTTLRYAGQGYVAVNQGVNQGSSSGHVHRPHPGGSARYPGQHVLTYEKAGSKPGI